VKEEADAVALKTAMQADKDGSASQLQ